MKKYFRKFSKEMVTLFLCLSLAVCLIMGCGGNKETGGEGGKTKVVLNEVAHSIFYAPMYVAIEEGYFADAGIELELVTGFGADKTMTACNFLHQLHRQLVVVGGNVRLGIDGSELVLCGSCLVVLGF